jgi:hypothetical protein
MPPAAPPPPAPTNTVTTGCPGPSVGQRHGNCTVGLPSTVLAAVTDIPVAGIGALGRTDYSGAVLRSPDHPDLTPD